MVSLKNLTCNFSSTVYKATLWCQKSGCLSLVSQCIIRLSSAGTQGLNLKMFKSHVGRAQWRIL